MTFKQKLFLASVILLALVTFTTRPPAAQSGKSFATQELANTFTQPQTFNAGIKLNGSSSGSVTINASSSGSVWTLILPAAAGGGSYLLCNTGTPGTLTFCPAPSGTFTAGLDLSGSSSSQEVIGLEGIAFSAAPTTTGQTFKYNSSTNKFDPGTCP